MKLIKIASISAALLMAGFSSADTLKIPLGHQASSGQASLPSRGASTQSVVGRHGEPTQRHRAIGQPPITRWDYADFSVYFEHDKVVHSVRQHRPRNN